MVHAAHRLPPSPATLRRAGGGGVPRSVPFRSVEQAWHWTMAALSARRDGTRRSGSGPVRPCDPDDIVRCLEQLYHQQRVGLLHARVLRVWGERQGTPDDLTGMCLFLLSDAARWMTGHVVCVDGGQTMRP